MYIYIYINVYTHTFSLCIYVYIHIHTCIYIDRGSSVKVKHSFVRESSNIYEFEFVTAVFKFGGRVGAVTIFGL